MPITSQKDNKKSIQIFDTNIIKKKLIELDAPISVGGEKNVNIHSSRNSAKDIIEPIIENDEIIGVLHHCSCGKITEIHFDY